MIPMSYVEAVIPAGMTIGDWRRQTSAAPKPSRSWWAVVRSAAVVDLLLVVAGPERGGDAADGLADL